jgi:hypothetical protein
LPPPDSCQYYSLLPWMIVHQVTWMPSIPVLQFYIVAEVWLVVVLWNNWSIWIYCWMLFVTI